MEGADLNVKVMTYNQHPYLRKVFRLSLKNMNSTTKIFIILLCLVCFQTAQAEWTKHHANTFAWFYDVYFLDENTGWIAGSSGAFFATKDGGKIWTKQKNVTQDTIRQVYFTNEKNGFLLCERDVFSRGSNSVSYLLKTTDGGASWEQIDFTGKTRIAKIFFSKSDFGLAIGEAGSLFAMQDEKKDWKRIATPVPYLLLDGVFTDDFHGTIVGGGGTILFTEDAGLSWKKASVFGNSDSKLNSVFFINQKNGWAAGANGQIYQTINGGKNWRKQNSTIEQNLTDIFFINTAEGWAVGEQGTILHTTTAGNVWNQEESKAKHKIEKLFFVGEKGWAVGFGGTILTYQKGESRNTPFSRPNLKNRK